MMDIQGKAWWYMPVLPAIQQEEIGGLQYKSALVKFRKTICEKQTRPGDTCKQFQLVTRQR
jgi:hypothetical protein